MTTVIDAIRGLSQNDEIGLTIEGRAYSGVCNEPYIESLEYPGGIALPGSLWIDVEFDTETYEKYDDLTEIAIKITARETATGWTEPIAMLWDPTVDVDADGYVIDEDWRELGIVEEVEKR